MENTSLLLYYTRAYDVVVACRELHRSRLSHLTLIAIFCSPIIRLTFSRLYRQSLSNRPHVVHTFD